MTIHAVVVVQSTGPVVRWSRCNSKQQLRLSWWKV